MSKNTAGISGVRNTLSKFQRWYRGLTGDRRRELEEMAPVEETTELASDGIPVSSSTMTGNVATREQALAALRQIASFFLKTEPHSPLAYALDQAVRWGKMPLPDLLKEIVEDDASLKSVFKRMGIQDKPDESA